MTGWHSRQGVGLAVPARATQSQLMEDRTPSGVRGWSDAVGAAPSWATSGPQASGQQRITGPDPL
jgi:hypothetical protein